MMGTVVVVMFGVLALEVVAYIAVFLALALGLAWRPTRGPLDEKRDIVRRGRWRMRWPMRRWPRNRPATNIRIATWVCILCAAISVACAWRSARVAPAPTPSASPQAGQPPAPAARGPHLPPATYYWRATLLTSTASHSITFRDSTRLRGR
mgnify:CR=1 FL=1